MKIAFFGLPLAALLLLADGHTIVYAGICRKGSIGTRRLTRLLGKGRVFVRPNLDAEATLSRVREGQPDIVVSWFWTSLIPTPLRSVAPLGAFGVHPSLLPRHRGPDPYFWAIERGDPVTGVTAHQLDEGYDTGAILGTRELAINPDENAWQLAKRLDCPSLELLRTTASAYARGEPPSPRQQDESAVTLANSPTEDELEVEWSRSADEVVRRVRAAAPWPGAVTAIGELSVILTSVRATRNFPKVLEPGQAYVRPDGVAVVRAGDDAVELLCGRIERDDGDVELGAPELAEQVRGAIHSS